MDGEQISAILDAGIEHLTIEEFQAVQEPQGFYYWGKVFSVRKKTIGIKYRNRANKWIMTSLHHHIQSAQATKMLRGLLKTMVKVGVVGDNTWIEVNYKGDEVRLNDILEKWKQITGEMQLAAFQRDLKEITSMRYSQPLLKKIKKHLNSNAPSLLIGAAALLINIFAT